MRSKIILIGLLPILLIGFISAFSSHSCMTYKAGMSINHLWALENDGEMSEMKIDERVCKLKRKHLKKDVDINIIGMWAEMPPESKETDVIVAVIDSGIDFSNPSLERHIWINEKETEGNLVDDDNNGYIDDCYGWDFTLNTSSGALHDELDHGTSCAGLICADPLDNAIGISPFSETKVMSLKVFENPRDDEEIIVRRTIEAIQYAESNGVRICNVSFGMNNYNYELYNCIKDSKMLFICSAGNGDGFVRKNIDKHGYYPASFELDNIISVANVGFDGELYLDSNYGKKTVDVCSPGTNMYVIHSNGKENSYATGTSLSVPVVSGIAANLILIDHTISNEHLHDAICSNVKKLPSVENMCKSGGIVDAHQAALHVKKLLVNTQQFQ